MLKNNRPADPSADNEIEAQPLNQPSAEQPQAPGIPQEQGERRKNTAIQSSLQRSILILKFLISFSILVDVVYAWLLCGLSQACLFNGIESPAWLSRTVLLFMAITFFSLVIGYKFVSVMDKEWIRVVKLILFIWGIVLIIFSILSFILLSGGSSLDDKKLISELSDIAQQYYNVECSSTVGQECLNSKYDRNSLLIAIFHLVNGVLIFIIFAMLINTEIPDHFRPVSTSRKLGAEISFITVDKRYSNPIKRKRQFDDDLYNGQGNNNEQDNQNIGQLNNNKDQSRLVEGEPNPQPFRNLQKPYS